MLIRKPTKIVRNWHADTRSWEKLEFRAGDIVVVTPPKCGTTWMQRILDMFLHQSVAHRPFNNNQPWIDAHYLPDEVMFPLLDSAEGRRALKSHAPLTALPFHDDVLYINVARDPRDACMSFHNHATAYTDSILELMDRHGLENEAIAAPYPRAPKDPRDFFRRWLRDETYGLLDDFTCREMFELESSFWEERHQPNVLMVHFNDLKTDRDGEMRRIARFCGIETPEPLWSKMVEAAGFSAMKRGGEAMLGDLAFAFDGGANRFIHKGTNGRWVDILTPQDLADYAAARDEALEPALANWIEKGRLVAGDPSQSDGANKNFRKEAACAL